MKRILLIGVSVLVGLIVVAAAALWLFFDVDQFRPRLEAAMGGAVGRKVALGKIRLELLSGSVGVDDVSIGDDPAFGSAPFVTARSVSVGVDMMSLIMSRNLRVESFQIQEPRVTLLRSAAGTWNFSGLGAGSPSPSGGGGPAAAAGVLVRKITISNGQIVVGDRATPGKERVYDSVNVEMSDLSLTSRFPFEMTAKTPGGGTVSLKGEAGPVDAADASATPFQAAVELKQLDIASTGFVDPASGLSGAVDFSGEVTSDGRSLQSKGKVHATRMQLVAGGSPSGVPFDLDYESQYTPGEQRGVLKQVDVHIGKALAQLTGDYNVAGQTPAAQMTLTARNMPATEVQAALPAIGVRLPSGASLRQGTLDTDLTIAGPVNRLVITGKASLSHGVVAGFDLDAKLGPVLALAGLPPSGQTDIETLGATLRVAPDGIRVDSLNLVVPTIGTLTGGGTISPGGALAFTMLAMLASTRGATGEIARLGSLGQRQNGVPFRVGGTTANPTFSPDVGRAVSNVLKSDETKRKAAELLGGLLSGRKK